MHSHKSFYSKLLNARLFFFFKQNESQEPIHTPLMPEVSQARIQVCSTCCGQPNNLSPSVVLRYHQKYSGAKREGFDMQQVVYGCVKLLTGLVHYEHISSLMENQDPETGLTINTRFM